jgi:hypothetical protein
MKWKRERDLLVAQTLAFVQSVTGKKSESDANAVEPDALQRGSLPPDALPPDLEAALVEAMSVGARNIEPKGVTAKNLAAKGAATRSIAAQSPETITRPEPPRSVPISRKLAPSEFQAEMQSRIANFRAHQQRFDRERAEYFSETLAKLRAAINNDRLPPLADK